MPSGGTEVAVGGTEVAVGGTEVAVGTGVAVGSTYSSRSRTLMVTTREALTPYSSVMVTWSE